MSQIDIKNILDKKLKKDYQVTVPYKVIDERIDVVVADIRKKYKQDGFRPGQVPAEIIKKKYEASIMAEESEKIINETSRKIVDENELRLALAPKVDIKTFEPKKDFEYVVAMELLPEVPEIDLAKVKVTKFNAEITDSEIDESIEKIVANYKDWKEQDAAYKAKLGDAVNIDYVGSIDKEEFEGGSAKGHQLELGTKSFIDDFEDQLVGKKAGDEVSVKVKFPKEYHSEKFAGKKAVFEVKVNKVLCADKPEINDEFVKQKLGLESADKLKELVKNQITSSYEGMTRNLFKKDLFDLLNKKFDFELPEGLVEEQFVKVWAEIEEEIKQNPEKFKNDKEKEKAKAEKRKTSERMVRSGLILSEISKVNKIEVTNEDLIQEVNKKAMQYPGQEKMVAEYYQKNPSAIQDLRGMLLEEKVIDFILEKAGITDKTLPAKSLEKEFNKRMTS